MMNDDKDKKPEDQEERTVFMPATPAPDPERTVIAPAETPTAPPAAPDPERTVIAPAETPATPPPAGEVAPPPPPPAAPAEAAPAAEVTTSGAAAIAPREGARPIKIGDCLNHIFEVKKFLARGGMGEVFEGCNVNTDERVAIKVMLPAMAADEKVVAMFRKEARTLTKLQHEALVQYRVLAQEPTLGALYIVTEFIEGVQLADVLGTAKYTPDQLKGLLARLASGLGAAHRLGAIHRDMSPDNVMMPGGDVHQAKIIDFGIAKDLDASSATIVGDGFAGKLNYVAPEQLGDFGRDVGPWTDVYSLALVILAAALGKSVNMSGSLVDAIDKRRKGPDLSGVPDSLRGVLKDMLEPDPKQRIRSMEEVIERLGGKAGAPPPPPPPSDGPEVAAAPARSGSNKGLLVGGGLAALLVLGAGGYFAFSGGDGDGKSAVASGDPAASAKAAVDTVLPSVGCTWLDVGQVGGGDGAMRVAMRGVAGDATAAQREIEQALTGAGLQGAKADFGDVAPITPAGCATLDTFRQVRANADYKLSVAQPRFEMVPQGPTMPYAGREAANAVVELNLPDKDTEFTLLGIEPSGAIETILADGAAFRQAVSQSTKGRPIADLGNGKYRMNIDLDHEGWSGIILVSGRGPFDQGLVAPPFGARGPSWQEKFLSNASEHGWRVEMVWFESVNEKKGS